MPSAAVACRPGVTDGSATLLAGVDIGSLISSAGGVTGRPIALILVGLKPPACASDAAREAL